MLLNYDYFRLLSSKKWGKENQVNAQFSTQLHQTCFLGTCYSPGLQEDLQR